MKLIGKFQKSIKIMDKFKNNSLHFAKKLFKSFGEYDKRKEIGLNSAKNYL